MLDPLSYNGIDGRNQRFRVGAVPTEMGHELNGLGAGALSHRQPLGSARSAISVSLARDRCARPKLSPDRFGLIFGEVRYGSDFPTRSGQGRSPSIASMSACSRPLRRLSPAATSQSASARCSTSSSEAAVCSTGLPISMPRHSTRKPAACAPNSCPRARPADLVTNSTRIESDICQWARRLT